MSHDILDELVEGILNIMKSSVERIILYGSVARGTQTDESDVDIAIIIRENMNPQTEDALSDFIVDMNLAYDKVFSAIDIDYDMFRKWENIIPFYKNIKKEGIVLWKAA